jgi:hypothetical protein
MDTVYGACFLHVVHIWKYETQSTLYLNLQQACECKLVGKIYLAIVQTS